MQLQTANSTASARRLTAQWALGAGRLHMSVYRYQPVRIAVRSMIGGSSWLYGLFCCVGMRDRGIGQLPQWYADIISSMAPVVNISKAI